MKNRRDNLEWDPEIGEYSEYPELGILRGVHSRCVTLGGIPAHCWHLGSPE
jgi:hypothetical protein